MVTIIFALIFLVILGSILYPVFTSKVQSERERAWQMLALMAIYSVIKVVFVCTLSVLARADTAAASAPTTPPQA